MIKWVSFGRPIFLGLKKAQTSWELGFIAMGVELVLEPFKISSNLRLYDMKERIKQYFGDAGGLD